MQIINFEVGLDDVGIRSQCIAFGDVEDIDDIDDLVSVAVQFQQPEILLRRESARFQLWDDIAYVNASGRQALAFALNACGVPAGDPRALRGALDRILKMRQEEDRASAKAAEDLLALFGPAEGGATSPRPGKGGGAGGWGDTIGTC